MLNLESIAKLQDETRGDERDHTSHNNSPPTKRLRLNTVGVGVGLKLMLGWDSAIKGSVFT